MIDGIKIDERGIYMILTHEFHNHLKVHIYKYNRRNKRLVAILSGDYNENGKPMIHIDYEKPEYQERFARYIFQIITEFEQKMM